MSFKHLDNVTLAKFYYSLIAPYKKYVFKKMWPELLIYSKLITKF